MVWVLCRKGRVFEVQTMNNGTEKVKAMLRKGYNGTIVPIKRSRRVVMA